MFRRLSPIAFALTFLAASLLAMSDPYADDFIGPVYKWRSTGQAHALDIPPLKLSLPNSAVSATGTATYTRIGTVTTTTTAGGLATATATVTDTQWAASIAAAHLCSATPASGCPLTDSASKLSTSIIPDLSATYVSTSSLTSVLTAYQLTSAMTGYATTGALANYVQTSAIEGTGTATSTDTGKIVHAGDSRLSDARASTNTVYASGNLAWKTSSTTATSTAAPVSANPTLTQTATATLTLVTPQGTTLTFTGSTTMAGTDIATTTPASGAIPMAGTNSKISTEWIVSAATSQAGIAPAGSGSTSDVLRGDYSWGPPGGTVSISDSVPVLDAHDVAMFRFAEAYGSTTFANTVADGNTFTSSVSTAIIAHSIGLHEGWSVRHTGSGSFTKSGYTKWENAQFTVAMWFKLMAAPGNDTYFWMKSANQNSYSAPYYVTGVYVTSGGVVEGLLRLSTIGNIATATLPATAINLYEWVYMALTWDTHYLSLYLNGQLVARSSDQGGASIDYYNHGEWHIGAAESSGGGQGQTMYVTDFNICDSARSADTLLSNYRRGVSPTGKAFSW